MGASGVILNHRVVLSSSAAHATVGRGGIRYLANRYGAVIAPSEDDLRIARENEIMEMVGYIGFRSGSVKERNHGHALFDQEGIPERARIKRELTETKSAIIQSVVSVRYEDAEALGLSTRQDWERLLRAHWQKHIESLGVIAPEDIRFVAAMHVCDHSYHCHVFTWDASGRFDSLLPRKALIESRESFVNQVLSPMKEEMNAARAQARDELVAAVRQAAFDDDCLRSRVREILPEAGSLKHAVLERRHPKAAQSVSTEAAALIGNDDKLRALEEAYVEAAREHARLKGLAGDAFEAHMFAAKSDMDRRVANALIGASKPEALAEVAQDEVTCVANDEGPLLLPAELRRAAMIEEEALAFLSRKEISLLEGEMRAMADGSSLSNEACCLICKLPAVQRLPVGSIASSSLRSAWRLADAANSYGRVDPSDEAAASAMKLLAKALVISARFAALKATGSVAKHQMNQINTLKF